MNATNLLVTFIREFDAMVRNNLVYLSVLVAFALGVADEDDELSIDAISI
jgi:hypothetical protein